MLGASGSWELADDEETKTAWLSKLVVLSVMATYMCLD